MDKSSLMTRPCSRVRRRRSSHSLVVVVALSSVAAIGLLTGCGGPSESKPDAVALVLFDISRSTSGERPRELYRRAFQLVVDVTAKRGGLVAADIIDANPLAHSELPVKQFFKTYNPVNDNPDEFAAIRDQQKAQVIAAAEDLIDAEPGEPGSAILDALNLTQSVFDSYPSARQKYMVILSDMVEESDRYRFTKRNLLPTSVRAFIRKERTEGELAQLQAVEAYVIGAGVTGGAKELKPATIRAIRHFWLAYFEATGANLPAARYGPAPVRFP
jgi:hypothetical protein